MSALWEEYRDQINQNYLADEQEVHNPSSSLFYVVYFLFK